MARLKTLPAMLRHGQLLADRIKAVRTELFGTRGGPELARRLGIPVRTWYNYEAGITIPGLVLLKMIELTLVEPIWLLHGIGPRFSGPGSGSSETIFSDGMEITTEVASAVSSEMATSRIALQALLNAALQLLEDDSPEASIHD